MSKNPTPAEITPTNPEFCLCGCSEKVGKKSFFRPGHDARHVSNLLAVAIADNLTWAGAVEQILPALPSEALKIKFTGAWNRYQDRQAKKAQPRKPKPTVTEIAPLEGHAFKAGRWTYPVRERRYSDGTIVTERNLSRDGSGEWVEVNAADLIDA